MRPTLWRRAKRVALVLLVLAGAVLGGLGALVGTEAGSAWLLAEAAHRAGIDLRYAALRGTLVGRLEFDALEVHAGPSGVRVERVQLAWRPWALFDRRLEVAELRVHAVTLLMPPAAPDTGAEPSITVPELPALSIPLRVHVAALELGALRVGADDAPRALDTLAFVLDAEGDTVRIHELSLAGQGIAVAGTLTLRLRGDWPVDGRLTLTGRAGSVPLDLQLTVTGTAREPALALASTAPLTARGHLRADLRDARPVLGMELDWTDAAVAATAPLVSPSGRLQLSTAAKGFDATLQAHLGGAPGGLSEVSLHAKGTLESLRAPFPLDAALEWTARAATGDFAGRGRVEGSLDALQLTHVLEEPFHVATRGSVHPAGSGTTVDLAGDWRGLTWPPGARDAPASPSGRYALAGTLAALAASVDAALERAGGVEHLDVHLQGGAALHAPNAFTAALRWNARTGMAGALSGDGTVEGDSTQLRFTHRVDGPGQLNTAGSVTLAPALALDVTGSWRDLRWPLDGTPAARADSGNFAVKGRPGALQASVDAALHADPVGAVALRASALVGDSGAREIDVRADLLRGRVRAAGQVDWAPALAARLDVTARGIDPAGLQPQAGGRLDADLGIDVQMRGAKPIGSVSLRALDGTLGGYPVRGRGEIALDADGFDAREVSLRTGDNTLTVSGRVGDALDLHYRLDAPVLAQLWPGFGGKIKGEGTLAGTLDAPVVSGELDASALRAGDARIAALTLRADVDLAQERRSSVRASASGIVAGGQAVDEARLDLDGTRAEHRLTLSADTSEGKLSLAARGGLRERAWSGEIGALSLEKTSLGDWRLERPAALTLDAGGARSEEACLRSGDARLCVDADLPRAAEQSVKLSLDALALDRFAPWLPPEVTIDGALSARAEAASKDAGPWSAHATITATPTRVALPAAAGDKPLALTLDDARVEARYGPDGTSARVEGRIAQSGSLRGELRLGPPRAGSTPLTGAITAQLPDLSPFATLVPALRELAGRLEADLRLAGSLAQPEVLGTVSLSDARASVPAAGITIERTTLRVTGDADGGFRVEGGAHSGDGQVTIAGTGNVRDGAYRARLSISGKDFEAVRTVPVQASVSPDLVVDATPARIDVSGKLHVPRALVTIQELPPDVVRLSDDETIRGREPAAAAAWRKRLRAAVDLSLGKDVQVSAFGLDTHLAGGLALAVDGASAPTARGTVSLVDGRFTAYGQDLAIRRGRLLFAGPLDNPGLDFRAVRDAGEVVAGIEVSGPADRMRSRVFSEPPLPQAEALAWLLTGRGLSGASSSDGATLAGAAAALGLEQGDVVTRQIGTRLGLDELTVAPGGALNESALVLGKALTPRLFIRYALGVLDGQGSVQLNYRITDSISVEAESGTRQGADVIYRLER